MASYRNSFANYFSDKTGNHSPVGSILPVFADLNLATQEPEYTYPQHLYCDGKSLKIRDYPELYSIIKNTYGGSSSQTITQPANPGGLRRSYIINNKLFFQFYYDSTNNKANVKRPYPFGAVFRFQIITNPWGAFPSAGIFDQSTFYQLIQPTEDVSSQTAINEFAYEVVLPDSVDLSTVTSSDYTNNFVSGDAHPALVVQKGYTLQDYPYNIGTFNLPDYRQRKIVGFGNVNGAGTSTPENAVNNFVGQTGGQWYIAKNTLIDSGEFFVIGDVRTTGYNTIVSDIAAYITGTVKYQIGPMDDYTFPFPPTHSHRMLSSEVDETKLAELGPTEVDKFAVNYINSRANVNIFEPNGSAGGALGHSHGLIGVPLQNTLTATYGNSNGIGDTAGTTGGQQYQYLVSESASVNVTSVTYDANTNLITVNTDGNHNLSVNDIVTVDNASPSEYSGNFTIVATGFGLGTFSVEPRTGEVPQSSPASGSSIIVKLANGYFVDTEVVVPPRAYVVDTNTLVGGKQVQFDIPGNSFTIKEETFTTPQAALVTVPDASGGTVTGCIIQLNAPGGGGADSDTDGQNGGYAEVGITVDGTFYTIRAEGGSGGTAGNSGAQQVLQTRDWLAVGAGQISAGAAGVWSTFMLNNAIYPVVPTGGSDPNVGNWVEGGVGIEVDATLAAAGFNVEFHADGSSEMDLYNPDGTWKQGNATPPNTTGPGVPYTSSATLVVPANTLVVGWNQLRFRIRNDSAANNSWDNNPGGIAFVGTSGGSTIFTSRGNCTGGITTTTVPGTGGGAGGAGGTLTIPQALLDDARFNISQIVGDNGDDGGYTGNGTNDAIGGGVGGVVPAGAQSTGGTGTAQQKSSTITQPQTVYTSNGSWSVPAATAGEVSRTINIEISGGGGGAGNANANSGCVGQWPGWPQAMSGKTGALGGYGGRGARLIGTANFNSGTISWEIGQGGLVGFNRRSGTSGAGTTGNDPATGQPWGPPWPGGVGTGSESGGTPGVLGATGTLSGAGGPGAWGNGATAGSGGGVTGIYFDGTLIAGAGGGGGGGGSGGGNNGGGTVDGCYPGGDAQGPNQSLIAESGPIDFAGGGSGSGGGCSAGGGAGGGAACGIFNVTPGGVGGQAGVGHNGNGGGTGGTEGISAYRTTFWSGGVTADSNGSLPTEPGYVKIQYSTLNNYFDNVGGGGGQGGQFNITFSGGIVTPVTVTLQGAGIGGGLGDNGGNGRVFVRYFGQEEGTTVPGGTTNPTGKYYECDSLGNPIGVPLGGDVWQSSTDPNIKQRGFGTGTGSEVGFLGGSNIPFNTQNKIQQYIEFKGLATDASGKRQLEVGQFDLSGANKMRFTVIRGSGQNGGENPDQALNVFYKKGTSNNVTLFSQILLAANSDPTWQTVDIDLPEGDAIRALNVTLILEQDRGPIYQTAPAADDNYGLGAITFFYDSAMVNTFISTGGATLQGNIDEGNQPINSDDGINQVRREITAVGAALTVTDGEFTMSSSTPITTLATVSAENNIPLITKYHRVKYLIKAL